jgi:hypothetical protein
MPGPRYQVGRPKLQYTGVILKKDFSPEGSGAYRYNCREGAQVPWRARDDPRHQMNPSHSRFGPSQSTGYLTICDVEMSQKCARQIS